MILEINIIFFHINLFVKDFHKITFTLNLFAYVALFVLPYKLKHRAQLEYSSILNKIHNLIIQVFLNCMIDYFSIFNFN